MERKKSHISFVQENKNGESIFARGRRNKSVLPEIKVANEKSV